jgi:polyphosphate kinase
MTVKETCIFRVSRNADVEIEEDEAGDLISTMPNHCASDVTALWYVSGWRRIALASDILVEISRLLG